MKNLKNLGKALTKAEQRMISGGSKCHLDSQCSPNTCIPSGGGFNYISVCRQGECALELC